MSRSEDVGELIEVNEFQEKMKYLFHQYDKMNERDQRELPTSYFDFNTFRDDYSVEDIKFRSNEELVEEYIKKEVDRTRLRDHQFTDHPNKLNAYHNFNTSMKPEIMNRSKPNLISLTNFGQVENGSMFSKTESNYLSEMFKSTSENGPRIESSEILLLVGIYHPTTSSKNEEFIVLGSQFLTELKDRIYCLCDHVIKDPRHASYFFVENVFYNDTRKTDLKLSKEIIQFANKTKKRKKKKKFQNFREEKMEETRFIDLKLRIGKRYLYCHNGCCRHYIIFQEVRVAKEKEDNFYRENYPMKTFQSRIRRKKCHICEIFPAKFVTFKSQLSMFNPTFWCNECYDKFFYGEDGKLIDKKDFQVFRYYHD